MFGEGGGDKRLSISHWTSNKAHENILLYMGTCMQDGKLMIVMELVRLFLHASLSSPNFRKLDTDLHRLLHESEEPLSLYVRMKMCRDVAMGNLYQWV